MKTKILHLGTCFMLLFLATSCFNNSKTKNLLDQIPADLDIVVVGDAKTIIESAGGTIEESQIILPSYLTDEMSNSDLNEYDKLKSFLKNSGIDVNACAIAGNYSDSNPIVVFALQDQNKFTKTIEENDFREKDTENGVIYYKKEKLSEYGYNQIEYIAIKDSYGYYLEMWAENDLYPMKNLQSFIEDATENSFGSTPFNKFITAGNAAGMSFKIPSELRQKIRKAGIPNSIAELYEGFICLNGNLSDNTAEINMKWFSENGQEKRAEDFANFMDLSAKISRQALSYLGKDECLVYAASIKDMDWDSYMDMLAETARLSRSDRASLSIIQAYLEKIDGTIALGTGLTNGIQSIANLSQGKNVLNEFALSLIFETKPGKAKGIINDLKGLMESQQIEFEDNNDGFSLTIPDKNEPIYVEAKDNIIILSTHKIKNNNHNATIEKIDFTNYTAAIGFVLDKNNQLMKDLEIDQNLAMAFSADAQTLEFSLSLSIDGEESSAGVIAKLAKTFLGIISQEEKLEKKWNASLYGNNDYNYNSQYGSTIDTIVVVE